MGETVTLFVDRCVMCTRCVRFCREISGTSELLVINRGSHEEIDVLQGFPLDNKLSGNVVDLCPVGALGDKDFLYQQRVWFLKQHSGVCTGCSTGCSITVEENQDRVWRLKPRENPHVNKWWMCDDGRYGFHHVHDEARQVGLRKLEHGVHANVEWATLAADLGARLSAAGRLAAVLSPHLTVEEAYLLAKYMRSLDASAVLAVGPVPVVGDDETFKNGFTIRAEKAPNRRGVEEVVKHFGGHLTFDALLAELDKGEIRGAGSPAATRAVGLTQPRPSGSPAWMCWSCKICSSRRCGTRLRTRYPAARLPSATARTSITLIACNASSGPCVRRPAPGSRGRCTGASRTRRAVQLASCAGRNRSRDSLFRRCRRRSARYRGRLEIEPTSSDRIRNYECRMMNAA